MIVCAAIKIETGEVFSGRRHFDCIQSIIKAKKHKSSVAKGAIQGFLDDKGNFLNRKEAKKHFFDCGQVSVYGKYGIHPTELFSEDLYSGTLDDNKEKA